MSDRLKEPERLALTVRLVAALTRGGRLHVAPTAASRAEIVRQKRDSLQDEYDEATHIELGNSVAPNRLVVTHLVDSGPRCAVAAIVFDLKKSSTENSATRTCDCDKASLLRAIDGLGTDLRRQYVREPQRPQPPTDVPSGAQQPSPLESLRAPVRVSFKSTPSGAEVWLDGELICSSWTWACHRDVELGQHTVTMRLNRYRERTEQVHLTGPNQLTWRLEPMFAVVNVTSRPSRLPVTIDYELVGRTPLKHELDPGNYEIAVGGECYVQQSQRVRLRSGKARRIHFGELVEHRHQLTVRSIDAAGNPTPGTIYVDGRRLGPTPNTVQVAACARRIEVRGEAGKWSSSLDPKERNAVIVAELAPGLFPSMSMLVKVGVGVLLLAVLFLIALMFLG